MKSYSFADFTSISCQHSIEIHLFFITGSPTDLSLASWLLSRASYVALIMWHLVQYWVVAVNLTLAPIVISNMTLWEEINAWFQTDLDFKGFYSLVCQEKCVVDFHCQCWKQLKEDESLNNDKEFLGRECLTPGLFFRVFGGFLKGIWLSSD